MNADARRAARFPALVRFRAPDHIRQQLAAAAARRCQTASEFVRQAIIRELAAESRKNGGRP